MASNAHFRKTSALVGCLAPLLLGVAAPAFAQTAAPVTPDKADKEDNAIIVTGTSFRRADRETPSPVTVLTANHLANAGITNVADAVRSISSDNSGSIPIGFTAGFANGASGISLRGLTVNSTLVLFDGVRAAYYPAADDGQKLFVDLQTIPDAIVDHIEILKDGASSTYGADAIAGVVNVITKKNIVGFEGTAEGGVSSRKDAGEQRLQLTYGHGDLVTDGYNAYVSVEYERDAELLNKDRGFPYNTGDLSSIGGYSLNTGATAAGSSISAVVRPATESAAGNIFSGVPVTGGTYQILNPGGCNPSLTQHTAANGSYCEQDLYKDYSVVQPRQERLGVTAHFTKQVGDNAQAYAIFTYFQDKVSAIGFNSSIRQNLPLGNTTLPSNGTNSIVLPAILSNGQLNPNDPYAVAGCVEGSTCRDAQIFYRFGDIVKSSTTFSKTYRGATGINGTFGDGWGYTFDATAMKSQLDITQNGYLDLAGLTSAIEDGSYNFINPSANTKAVYDQIAPTVRTTANSYLYMGQGTITKDLMQLPGGALQLAVGGSVRYEKVDNPSANPLGTILGLNPVSASGHHTVEGVYFEVRAPIIKPVEVNISGRYDHYSEGFGHFSPKVGVKYQPFHQLAFRGTFSKGFRAPQFSETHGQVLGYITNPPLPQSVIDAHGNDQYVKSYSLGLLSVANPNLKPELSTSFTAGTIVQPTKWLSLTIDYYNIKKTRVISGGPLYGQAINDYYAGTPLPAGYSLVLNGADPDPRYAGAIQTVGQVLAPYVNAASEKTQGLDIAANAQFHFANGWKFSTSAEFTDIFKFDFKPGAGEATEHFVGTEAPYALSSGAGTPKWRGNVQATLEAGHLSISGTGYYTAGYKETAEDATGAGTGQDCTNELYNGDPAFCKVKRFIDVDFVVAYKVSDNFTLYGNLINAFDAKAPLNAANYAGLNYNPTYAYQGVIGRYFRVGARFKM